MNKLTDEHKKDLCKARKIISNLIDEVSSISKGNEIDEVDLQNWNLLYGDKENIVSVMNKLTVMLLKIIPLEQQLIEQDNRFDEDMESEKQQIIGESDKEIIKRYIKKFSVNKSE